MELSLGSNSISSTSEEEKRQKKNLKMKRGESVVRECMKAKLLFLFYVNKSFESHARKLYGNRIDFDMQGFRSVCLDEFNLSLEKERKGKTGDDDDEEEESFEKDEASLPSFVFLIIYLLVLLSATCWSRAFLTSMFFSCSFRLHSGWHRNQKMHSRLFCECLCETYLIRQFEWINNRNEAKHTRQLRNGEICRNK